MNHFVPTSYNGGKHQLDPNGVLVWIANNNVIQSTATNELNIPTLPSPARTCYKFPTISQPLFSVGHVCDANMQVLFDKNYVQIFNPSGEIVMNGYRHPTSITLVHGATAARRTMRSKAAGSHTSKAGGCNRSKAAPPGAQCIRSSIRPIFDQFFPSHMLIHPHQ